MEIIGKEVKSKATGAIGKITGIVGNKLLVTYEGDFSINAPLDILVIEDDLRKEIEKEIASNVYTKKETSSNSISNKKISPLIMKTPNMLYCNIAYMKYYKGITEEDQPYNGGRYIGDTGNAGEKYNFSPFDDEYMYGFFEPRFTKGGYEDGHQKELHIENIDSSCAYSDHLDNVIVIMCAKAPHYNNTVIVGWYENATVYRNVKTFGEGDNKKWMNFKCRIKDAYLIPEKKRVFIIPRAKQDGFGFGQSNFWYANQDNCYNFRLKTLDYLKELKK